jgi:uncharacterized protein YjcR
VVDWKKIKAEYIAGGMSYRELAEKHKVSFDTLAKLAAKENWRKLKQKTAEKITKKIIEMESEKQAERMQRLLTVSDKLLEAVEEAVEQFHSHELTLDRTALKSLSGTIKDIKEIQNIKTELDIEEQKARIAILKKQAEDGADTSREIAVLIEGGESAWAK